MDELHMYFLVLISQMYSQSKNQDDLFFYLDFFREKLF